MFALFLTLAAIVERPPDASDLIRFPDRQIASERYYEAGAAVKVFEGLYQLAPPHSAEQAHWLAAAWACERNRIVWLALGQAWNMSGERCFPVCMRHLKSLLTPLEYRTGQMPQPTPVWAVTN